MLRKQRIRILGLIGALAVAAVSASAQEKAAKTPKVVVEADGTVQVPEQKVPTSEFLSPEAKAYLTQHLLDTHIISRHIIFQMFNNICGKTK